MAIKTMWAFDHLPISITSPTATDVFPYVGIDMALNVGIGLVTGNLAGGALIGTVQDADGVWFTARSTTAAAFNFNGFAFQSARQFDQTKNNYFGFRVKFTQVPSPSLGLLYIANGLNNTAVVSPFVSSGDIPALAINKSYYIEVFFNRTGNSFSVRIDGVAIKTIAWTVATFNWIVFTNNQNNGSSVIPAAGDIRVKDVYFVDDSGDGLPTSTWLGPINAKPITDATGVGTGWTPSSGTIPSVLNTPISGSASLSAPIVTSPQTGVPIALTLATAADPTLPIKAVTLLMSAARTAGTAAVIHSNLTDQATPTPNVMALPNLTFVSDAMVPHNPMAIMTKAPDGGDWSVSKIQQLTMNVAVQGS